jgi:hypothetical protein
MRSIFIIASLVSGVALAGGTEETPCALAKAKPKAKASCPLAKPKTVVVEKKVFVDRPVVVTKTVPAPAVKDPCCDANKGKVETNVSNVNNNRFNINVGGTTSSKANPVRYRVIERVRIKTERVTVTVSNPNRFLILAGMAKTGAVAEVDSCCTATARSKYQVDLGAMYIRDISSLSVGLAVTLRQGIYVAGGFNF